MASIRKVKDKKKVLATSIPGFYIRALSIKESQELAVSYQSLSQDELKSEEKSQELTMALFGLACDEKGESFDEFATYEEIGKLTLEEFNEFATAIKDALVPGGSSEKKSKSAG
jgi:hypothetical protein